MSCIFLATIIRVNRTCGLVVRALASCLVGRVRVVRISAGSCQDLKNWNLLQSGQALGIMTAAVMQLAELVWLQQGNFTTMEGQFLCCALSVLVWELSAKCSRVFVVLGTRKAEVLNSLIINTTAKANFVVLIAKATAWAMYYQGGDGGAWQA